MKKFKRIVWSVCILFLLIPQMAFGANKLDVSATSSILINAETGEILWSKNPNSAFPPASTTKIMTALLTLENVTDFNEKVVVGKRPPLAEGNSIYLCEGEEISIENLFNALLIESANDAAEALAEHISGSVEEFAKLMTKRAKELGCTTANFKNPSGLYEPGHVASSLDLALIMKEVIKHPKYLEVSQKQYYIIAPTNKRKEKRIIGNNNRLVKPTEVSYYYQYAIAGKTGYTDESLHSYVAAAKKENMTLIATFVHDQYKTYFKDAVSLFDYGFNNFILEKLFSKGDLVTNFSCKNNQFLVPLKSSNDFYYVKKKGCSEVPQVKVDVKDFSNMNFNISDNITSADILLEGKDIGKIQLLSGIDHNVTTNNFITLASSSANNKNKVIIVSLGCTCILFIIILLFKEKKTIKRRW